MSRRADKAKSLRRFVRRLLAEWKAGREGDSCMEEIAARFEREAGE